MGAVADAYADAEDSPPAMPPYGVDDATLAEAVQAVSDALARLAAVAPYEVSDTALGEAVLGLARLEAQLESTSAQLGATWAGRGAWRRDGARSAAAWLATRTRAPKRQWGARLWLGRSVWSMGATAAAWRAGEIGAAQVRRLVGAHNPRSAEAFARDEQMLLGHARTLGFNEFCQAVDYWAQHADPDGAAESDIDRRDRRRVSLDQTIGGMWSGGILLDPVSGTIVADELARREQALFEADRAEARTRLGRDPLVGELARSADQRRADALVEMATRSGTVTRGKAPRPLFTVVLGADPFSRLCQLASGTVISPEALLPWICEAEIERILFDGHPQRAISVSRKRSFTGALRRVIEVRDGRCYHDYCDEPSARCQADHIVEWTKGGMTAQWNGRMACGFHNRLRNRRRPPPSRE